MMMNQSYSVEHKVINCFKEEVDNYSIDKGISFEKKFNMVLDKKSIIKYNLKNHSKEYDIMIFGEKRLDIGLLIDMPWNIEIETHKCNKNVINDKYDDNFLFSVIAVNGESPNALNSSMPYSFIEYKENFKLRDFDFKTNELPSIRRDNYNSSNPFNEIEKKYAFVPKVNHYCELITSKIERKNIVHLENILKSNIEPNMKRGILYYLCDNLVKESITRLNFIPELKQFSFINNNGERNYLIDSEYNRSRINNHLVSEHYEEYLTRNAGKRIAKVLNTKKFSLITQDEKFYRSCDSSEIDSIQLMKDNILQEGIGIGSGSYNYFK
ncbi:MAG: hypothetical protein PHN56_00875 [Candidatus Nanoarchaeia archaeon]|nr:hypothetical protein [Candidatus Nanoarchaeia archaeon]